MPTLTQVKYATDVNRDEHDWISLTEKFFNSVLWLVHNENEVIKRKK